MLAVLIVMCPSTAFAKTYRVDRERHVVVLETIMTIEDISAEIETLKHKNTELIKNSAAEMVSNPEKEAEVMSKTEKALRINYNLIEFYQGLLVEISN